MIRSYTITVAFCCQIALALTMGSSGAKANATAAVSLGQAPSGRLTRRAKCLTPKHHRKAKRETGKNACARRKNRHSSTGSLQSPPTPNGTAASVPNPEATYPGGSADSSSGSNAESGSTGYVESAPSSERRTEPPSDTSEEGVQPFRFFSPSSIWNTPVPNNAPVDPLSSQLIAHFVGEVAAERRAGKGPEINTTKWSVPIYTVPSDQPKVRVVLHSQPMRAPSATLASAWEEVPLPPTARPAGGTDRPLVVWQPSTNKMWEFWELSNGPHGWQAAWGGAIQNVNSNSGVYGPSAWPGADSSWGSSASSLSIAGGLITFEDLKWGSIDHALAMSIPEVRKGSYSSPANRDDGTSTNPLSLPEGAHLRLDPHLNLSSLHLPRPTLRLAEAAQRYGIFLRDRAGAIVFYGQDPTPTGANPYVGAGGYFEGFTPGQLMAAFPWEYLQVLKMELHES
jgi:hypothetical protein